MNKSDITRDRQVNNYLDIGKKYCLNYKHKLIYTIKRQNHHKLQAATITTALDVSIRLIHIITKTSKP